MNTPTFEYGALFVWLEDGTLAFFDLRRAGASTLWEQKNMIQTGMTNSTPPESWVLPHHSLSTRRGPFAQCVSRRQQVSWAVAWWCLTPPWRAPWCWTACPSCHPHICHHMYSADGARGCFCESWPKRNCILQNNWLYACMHVVMSVRPGFNLTNWCIPASHHQSHLSVRPRCLFARNPERNCILQNNWLYACMYVGMSVRPIFNLTNWCIPVPPHWRHLSARAGCAFVTSPKRNCILHTII